VLGRLSLHVSLLPPFQKRRKSFPMTNNVSTIFRLFLNRPNNVTLGQCCGSGSESESGSGSTGSTCFWASRIWIRILLSSCKNSKKNHDSYYFVTLFDFLSLKNVVNVASKSNKQKNCVKKQFFTGILKVNDANSRIRIQDPDPLVRGMDPRIRIRIHSKMSWIPNTALGNIFSLETHFLMIFLKLTCIVLVQKGCVGEGGRGCGVGPHLLSYGGPHVRVGEEGQLGHRVDGVLQGLVQRGQAAQPSRQPSHRPAERYKMDSLTTLDHRESDRGSETLMSSYTAHKDRIWGTEF
jgi:hypothetical protein